MCLLWPGPLWPRSMDRSQTFVGRPSSPAVMRLWAVEQAIFVLVINRFIWVPPRCGSQSWPIAVFCMQTALEKRQMWRFINPPKWNGWRKRMQMKRHSPRPKTCKNVVQVWNLRIVLHSDGKRFSQLFQILFVGVLKQFFGWTSQTFRCHRCGRFSGALVPGGPCWGQQWQGGSSQNWDGFWVKSSLTYYWKYIDNYRKNMKQPVFLMLNCDILILRLAMWTLTARWTSPMPALNLLLPQQWKSRQRWRIAV